MSIKEPVEETVMSLDDSIRRPTELDTGFVVSELSIAAHLGKYLAGWIFQSVMKVERGRTSV